MKKLLLIPALLLLMLGVSCGDDESTPDYVKESAGSYTYSYKAEREYGGQDLGTGNGTIKVNQSGDGITMIFDENTDEEVTFETKNIVTANNGFGFDVVAQRFTTEDGYTGYFRGVASASLGSVEYHGRYDTGTKQIYFSFKSDYDIAALKEANNVLLTVTATKK